jgi:cell shape-determining protein MreC
MPVDLVLPGVKLKAGDTLVTSGLQLERFPGDIPVGTVHSVTQPPGALQENVTISPVVDLSKLEFLQVLQWSPQ